MGNTVRAASDALFKEYEVSTGKLLFKAIRANSKKLVAEAIDVARKELANPNIRKNHEEDYIRMTEKMNTYLTRKYDVEEGFLNWKTPIEYAKDLGSEEVIPYIEEMIIQLNQKSDKERAVNLDRAPSIKAAVGTVDADRVALAKARLQELRNKK